MREKIKLSQTMVVLRYASQRGVSLIGMMVGLVLASIAILGLLAAYKSTAINGSYARYQAVMTEEWNQSLLSIDMDLQGAGFGIASPVLDTDIILLSGASLNGNALRGTVVTLSGTTTAQAGNVLLWGAIDPSSSYICRGIMIDQSTGTIKRLTASSGCTSDLSSWRSAAWSASTVAAPPAGINASAISAGGALASSANMQVKNVSCSPFGVSSSSGTSPQITIQRSVPVASGVSCNSVGAAGCQIINIDSICLSNFSS